MKSLLGSDQDKFLPTMLNQYSMMQTSGESKLKRNISHRIIIRSNAKYLDLTYNNYMEDIRENY